LEQKFKKLGNKNFKNQGTKLQKSRNKTKICETKLQKSGNKNSENKSYKNPEQKLHKSRNKS
jgi:hypothetical protein